MLHRKCLLLVSFLTGVFLTLSIQTFGSQPELLNGEAVFDREVGKRVAGNFWIHTYYTVAVAGILYDDYGSVGDPFHTRWGTYDVRGWDHFLCSVGISDDYKDQKGTVSFEVDGVQVMQKELRGGQKALPIDIPLTGQQSLTLRVQNGCWFLKPRLVKGSPAPLSPAPTLLCPSGGDGLFAPQPEANIAIDPNDLEKLASALRKRVEDKAEVKQRVEKGQIAVMTFTLVDILSPSVAVNVVEDISTSMINQDFKLVERGQLDKTLKELKVQNSALIDPSTAQRIGKLTGCDLILVGSISDRGDIIVINARLLETATGKAIAAERVEGRKNPIKREVIASSLLRY